MFLSSGEWRGVSRPAETLAELAERVTAEQGRYLRQLREDWRGDVPRVRRRPLSFYRGYDLVEIEARPAAFDPGERFRSGAVYALVSDDEVRLLDGKSWVIHQLNARGTGDDAEEEPVLRLDGEERARDYLDFFCTFVGGDRGHPFLIVESPEDLGWSAPDGGEEVVDCTFDVLVARRRQQLLWGPALYRLSRQEAQRVARGGAEALAALAREVHAWSDVGEASGGVEQRISAVRPAEPAPRAEEEPVEVGAEAPDPAESAWFDACVWYEGGLFQAVFEVRPNGLVLMQDDEPLGPLAASAWRFVPHLPVLARRRRRRLVSPDVVRGALGEPGATGGEGGDGGGRAGTADDGASADSIGNLRVDGDLDLRRLQRSAPLHLSDVEIDGDLLLEDARIGAAVILDRVAVTGRLIAPGLRCTGLLARGLRVEGLYPKGTLSSRRGPTASLDLHAARVEEDLRLQGATVRGPADLTSITCRGMADLSGVVVERLDGLPAERRGASRRSGGCDLSHGRFGSDLRIGVLEDADDAPSERRRRPLFEGGLDLRRCHVAGSLHLWGVRTAGQEQRAEIGADAVTDELLETMEETGDLIALAYDPGRDRLLRCTPGWLRGDLVLIDAVIDGDVDLGGLGSPTLSAQDAETRRSRIDGSLLAVGVTVAGDLACRGARLGLPKHALIAADAGVSGNLILSDARLGGLRGDVTSGSPLEVGGVVSLREARVDNDVALRRADVEGFLDAGGLELGGSLDLTGDPAADSRTRVGAWLSLFGARIGRSVGLAGMDLGGDLNVSRTAIEMYLTLAGARIAGSLSFQSARIGDMLDANSTSASRTEIGGDVILSGASVRSDTRFSGARIGGRLQAVTGTFGRIQLRAALVQADDPAFQPCEVGELLLQSLSAESVDLYALRASGRVSISDAEIGGFLSFFRAHPEEYLLHGVENAAARRREVPDGATVHARIGGDLELAQLHVGASLRLTNVVCRGRALLRQVVVDGHLLATARPLRSPGPGNGRLEARFADLRLENVTVGSDVLLDGIAVRRSFSAHNVTVDGEVRLASFSGATLDHADLPAIVTLSRLEAQALSFHGEAARRTKLDLSRADLDLLELTGAVPAHVDLRNARVGNWHFPRRGGARSGRLVRRVLARTSPFDRSNYLGVESWLRRQGDDALADEVHKDLHWRALAPAKRNRGGVPFRPGVLGGLVLALRAGVVTARGRRALVGALTGFWTDGARLLVLGGAIALALSLAVVTVPENVAPAGGAAGADVPPRAEWSTLEQGRLLLANHVPIVPLTGSAPWMLATGRPLHLRLPLVHDLLPPRLAGPPLAQCVEGRRFLPRCDAARSRGGELPARRAWRLTWMSPAAYGLWVRLFHWVAWPLALIGVAANLERRRTAH